MTPSWFALFVLLSCLPFAACASVGPAATELRTEVIDYRDGDVALQGYLAVPAHAGRTGHPLPAVMVVHEWRGHGEYVRHRAEMLARLGYVAFAADMYGKGVYAKDHTEAAALAGVYFQDRSKMRSRAAAGLAVLRAHQAVDPTRLAVMGYCFGGTAALECARAGFPGVLGVASFHGNLTTPQPAEAGTLQARVVVFHGADDQGVAKGLAGFEAEMRAAKADWQLVSFGGAVHSFTVPEAGADVSRGMAYDAKADARSWAMLQMFLFECLGR
jgi:dienelactone hydrolase